VVLGAGLAPRAVERLIEVLHEVGRLPEDKRHLIEPASEPDHLFGIGRKSLENIRGLATRRWWRPAKRDDRDLVTHDAVEIGFEQTRQQR
jgi:hypothetical protein